MDRCVKRFVLATAGWILITTPATAQSDPAWINVVTDTLPTGVGGLAVDSVGYIYSADFGDRVYRISPHGDVEVFATGLYGASGNAVDDRGNLLQANFFANTVSKIGRDGQVTTLVREGLSGPVGIAMDDAGAIFVANCRGNFIQRITPDGHSERFASDSRFRCPNGITIDSTGHLYTVNFADGLVAKITPDGQVSPLATIPWGGAHIVSVGGALYVTGFNSSRVYRVSRDGTVEPIAGNGIRGLSTGEALDGMLSAPNGIAADQSGERLYVNNHIGPFGGSGDDLQGTVITEIKLVSISDRFLAALKSHGLSAAVTAYHHYQTATSRNTETVVNRLGYRLLQDGLVTAAVAVFRLNAVSYPDSWNAYDSLGEAYRVAGDVARARESYEHSLEINAGNLSAIANLELLRKQRSH